MTTFVHVVLTIVIVTGPGKPDLKHVLTMPDMDTCFEEAKEFSHHQFPGFAEAKHIQALCAGDYGEPS